MNCFAMICFFILNTSYFVSGCHMQLWLKATFFFFCSPLVASVLYTTYPYCLGIQMSKTRLKKLFFLFNLTFCICTTLERRDNIMMILRIKIWKCYFHFLCKSGKMSDLIQDFVSFNVASRLTSHLLTQTASGQRGLYNLWMKSLRLTVRQNRKERVARKGGRIFVREQRFKNKHLYYEKIGQCTQWLNGMRWNFLAQWVP